MSFCKRIFEIDSKACEEARHEFLKAHYLEIGIEDPTDVQLRAGTYMWDNAYRKGYVAGGDASIGKIKKMIEGE